MTPQAKPSRSRRRFTIVLEYHGDGDEFQGLRRWLKAAWRCYSLRVIDYQTHPPLPRIGQPSPSKESPMKAKRISTLDAADLCPRPLADIEPAALGRLSRQALEAVAVAARDVVLLPDSLGDGIRLVQASGIERLQASIAAAVEAAGVSERRRRGDYLTVLAGRE